MRDKTQNHTEDGGNKLDYGAGNKEASATLENYYFWCDYRSPVNVIRIILASPISIIWI